MQAYRFKWVHGSLEKTLWIDDGVLATANDSSSVDFTWQDYYAVPGFIDGHIHGAMGCDVMDASVESIDTISRYLASKGVTAFLATTLTESDQNIERAIVNNLVSTRRQLPGAICLGTYLEGPFLSTKRKGAHPETLLQLPSLSKVDRWLDLAEGSICLLAVAPELDGALNLIKHLKSRGIKTALAHTDATFEQTQEAIKAGATIATHLFNGMRPMHHREGGVVSAVLLSDKIASELIYDGEHIADNMMQLALHLKKEKAYLISDCMRAGGLQDGTYRLGALDVIVERGIAKIATGSLAGSTLDLHKALKNLLKRQQQPLSKAVDYVTINVAKALGIENKMGSLKPGMMANITVLDDAHDIVATIVNGEVVYRRDESCG